MGVVVNYSLWNAHTTSRRICIKMKMFAVLLLATAVLGSEDYKMFMKWAKTKAMESCWGEDNMKLITVNMKKAVAKCQQQDVPELDLPPRRRRQADDSLALNDRLKEKLNGMMEEHVKQVSNMTCVLKELNVIDQNNNIDVKAIKEDSKQYKMPSQWFGDKYEEILESCHQVVENLPASLQEEYVPSNGTMRNLGKIKSFMNCCKTAKMKLCMYQDTKNKIEANFGPVDELVEGFNNQLTEEQVFKLVNELLQGSEDEFM